MQTYIALLKGINVGGRHLLKMKELVAILEGLGCQDVKTYIQSGNVVLRNDPDGADELPERISAAIAVQRGFEPKTMLLRLDDFETILSVNPFGVVEDPGKLVIYFLAERPRFPDLEAAAGLQRPSEKFVLEDRAFYLHAPEGIARSKLAERVERLLGVEATARNWRTLTRLQQLARSVV